MELRRADELKIDYAELRREWILGSQEFRRELLAAATQRIGPNHYGTQRQETALEKAEGIVKEELERLGWPDAHLRARTKGDQAKVAVARRLRQETTMSLRWI